VAYFREPTGPRPDPIETFHTVSERVFSETLASGTLFWKVDGLSRWCAASRGRPRPAHSLLYREAQNFRYSPRPGPVPQAEGL
jgi:hypothetical protein